MAATLMTEMRNEENKKAENILYSQLFASCAGMTRVENFFFQNIFSVLSIIQTKQIINLLLSSLFFPTNYTIQ